MPVNPFNIAAETVAGTDLLRDAAGRLSAVVDNRNVPSVMIADVTVPFVVGNAFPEPVQQALNAVAAARGWIHSNGTFFGLPGTVFVERIELTMPSPGGGFCEARVRLRHDA